MFKIFKEIKSVTKKLPSLTSVNLLSQGSCNSPSTENTYTMYTSGDIYFKSGNICDLLMTFKDLQGREPSSYHLFSVKLTALTLPVITEQFLSHRNVLQPANIP